MPDFQTILDIEDFPDYGSLPLQDRPERLHLYQWIEAEEAYVINLFDEGLWTRNEENVKSADKFEEFWIRQILQYLDRAKLFLELADKLRLTDDYSLPVSSEVIKKDVEKLHQLAMQAVAKSMMTAKGCAEAMIRIYGTMPKPGVPSGQIEEWK